MAQQIVVVGAGVAGLATAAALQRRGHDVSVVEARADTA
jgi:2-polyprenyl-6-methoxyphenol hydroxylase-like FAD-dependent oxidoreductase